jgi:hypothetical protein
VHPLLSWWCQQRPKAVSLTAVLRTECKVLMARRQTTADIEVRNRIRKNMDTAGKSAALRRDVVASVGALLAVHQQEEKTMLLSLADASAPVSMRTVAQLQRAATRAGEHTEAQAQLEELKKTMALLKKSAEQLSANAGFDGARARAAAGVTAFGGRQQFVGEWGEATGAAASPGDSRVRGDATFGGGSGGGGGGTEDDGGAEDDNDEEDDGEDDDGDGAGAGGAAGGGGGDTLPVHALPKDAAGEAVQKLRG